MNRSWLVLLFVLLAPPNSATAAWLPDGVLLYALADGPRIAPDGQGGAFVVWTDYRSSTELELFGTRIAADGTFGPGWPSDGTPICMAPGSNPYLDAAAPDGQGGAFFVWEDGRNNATDQLDIYVQRIMPDGTIAPGWPINGAQADNSTYLDQEPVIAPDGKGGVFVAWYEIRNNSLSTIAAQHLTATGAVAAGWAAEGLSVCGTVSTSPVSVIADGTGGAVVAWRDFRRGGHVPDGFDVYVQRLTTAGAIAPGWATNGLLLSPGAWTPVVLPDPTGGFYLIAGTPSLDAGGEQRYTVLRFALDGTPALGWPAGGVLVCDPSGGDRQNINAVSDGFGGVLMDWYDDRLGGYDIYASRVLPGGTLAAGFPTGGLRVSNPIIGTEYLQPDGDIVADGQGGAYMAWSTSQSIGYPSYIQHITAAGAVAAGWPQYGLRVASTCVQDNSRLVPDGSGGAVVAWNEADGNCSRLGVFAQRYVMDGVVATQISLVSTDAQSDHVSLMWQSASAQGLIATVYRRTDASPWQSLGAPVLDAPDRLSFIDKSVSPGARYAYRLGYTDAGAEQFTSETWVDVPRVAVFSLEGARPNPAVRLMNVSLSLANDSPATLTVLDVAGRTVTTREVGSLGAGRHVVPLDPGTQVMPGLYWLRLTQGGRTLLSKAAIVR